jgi:tetratricopeptide (TPR) repeat protein
MTYTAYAGALRAIGQVEKAIGIIQRAIEQLPEHREFSNTLAYLYTLVDQYDQALQVADRLVEAYPGEPNSYDTRGDIYAYQGDLDRAIENYRRATEIEFYFGNSAGKLVSMYLYQGNYARAERLIDRIADEPDVGFQSAAWTSRAYLALYRGRFDRALGLLDEGIQWDRKNDAGDEHRIAKHNIKFLTYMEQEQFDLAWKEAEELNRFLNKWVPDDPFATRTSYALIYAAQGRMAKTDSLVQIIQTAIDPKSPAQISGYERIKGAIEYLTGDAAAAIEHLHRGLYDNAVPLFENRYLLGLAYLEAGRPAEAAEILEPALRRCDEHMMQFPIWAVKARFYLGQAYDRLGRREEALDRYEEFLEIWQDADEGLAEVEEARERVVELKMAAAK